jgi:sulfite exporter TauE/SafE
MKKVLFVLGIILALIGAAIMIEGSILGERTIPAAVLMVIVGICLIATSSPWKVKKT